MNNCPEAYRERSEFVLNNNFVDIRNSKYFEEIKELWENLGFLGNLEGDKRDYCSIAFEQMAAFLMNDENLTKAKEIDEKIEVNVFAIILGIYEELPFSEYNYREILDALTANKKNRNDFSTDDEYVRAMFESTKNYISSK